jgi:hypothetical protein
MQQTNKTTGTKRLLNAVAIATLWLAGAASGLAGGTAGAGENDPAARFRGPLAYDFGVTNVKWEAATPDYSYVTFDLYWSYSWRAKWVEPAKTSATGKDMEVENWDAAWVFVKFLPEKDSQESIERNHWQHATLDADPTQHVMPAGATNSVKLSDDPSTGLGAGGARGMGVFIHRDAVGHGVNDWKGIKLRWLHPQSPGTANKVDPAKAAVKVHAIPMVYVPAGPFKVGSGAPSGIYAKFADGPDMPIVQAMNNIRTKNQEMGGMTDGSWRGGPSIPFLMDAEWNGPAAEGTRARRFGISAGEIWGTHTYWEVNVPWIGGTGVLNDEYPTGYDAFYCMKHDLTQGQYVDFLNSLPPDVAAERAFVGGEVGSDAGMHSLTVAIELGPGRGTYTVVENGGCTIYSSADIPERVEPPGAEASADEEKKNDGLDNLLEQTLSETKSETGKSKAKATVAGPRPVYSARLPFRKLPGPTPSDTIAYAVWAGLRPMSQTEGAKAGTGAHNPLAPLDCGAPPKDFDAQPVLLDEGLPTERYLKGRHQFGSSMATRAGSRSTPTSDRGTALATYWGISELQGPVMPLTSRGFRGTHGNGMTSPGKPGAPFNRVVVKFQDAPADWPEWWAYLRGHFVELRCRLVASADNRIRKPAGEESARAANPKAARPEPAGPIPPLDGRQNDLPQVANVKVVPGKDFSTVSFDLAWKNSWRAKWTEPAEKNCTGKPLQIESWDAAWVFLKFRRPDTRVFSHATLSPDAAHHVKSAGAALDLGLSDDGAKGVGVFIYRDAVGQGNNEFKGIKLRWQDGADKADPATAELSVHALAMVYVPEGPFRSKSPLIYTKGAHWVPEAYECKLMTIDTPDTTKPSGHANFSTNYVREGPDWPNGYSAFYCMKYSISQGEYAGFLTEAAPDPRAASYNGGQYGYLPHNASRRYAPGLYGLSGYTIRYSAGEGRYEADVLERPANFLSDPDIQSFTAWAGLRPLTKLEYEKACRGPRAAARDEDAWAPGACAPAAGLAQFVPSLSPQDAPATGRLAWPGPSYWGIRDLSQSGAIIEWPAVMIEDGRGFSGRHGTGSPDAPGGWVFTSRGEWYALGSWQGFPLSEVGVWLLTEDYNRMPGDIGEYISTRSGRYGARAVRTAVGRADKDLPLQVDALPNMVGYDLAVVNVSGRFRNAADKPLKVELASALPASYFLGGAASRSFTAAAKAVTPFKVPLVLTRASTNAMESWGRTLILPLQIKGPGGETLGEDNIRLPSDVLTRQPGAVQSLDGGTIGLKVKNATENPLTLALEMASLPTVRIGETKRTLTVAAGGEGVVAFPVPRQSFPREGLCLIPYRVTIGSGTVVLPFATSVELRTQTRWWIRRPIQAEPRMAGEGDDSMNRLESMSGGVLSEAGDVFTLASPSKGWKSVMCGSAVTLDKAGSLQTQDSKVIGVTRAIAFADADAIADVRPVTAEGGEMSMNPSKEGVVPFFLSVWVNDKLVFDSRQQKEARAKPTRLRKGANTVVVEWRSNRAAETVAGSVRLQFNDATTGKPVPDVLLDMEKR